MISYIESEVYLELIQYIYIYTYIVFDSKCPVKGDTFCKSRRRLSEWRNSSLVVDPPLPLGGVFVEGFGPAGWG